MQDEITISNCESQVKRCIRCLQTLPVERFYTHKSSGRKSPRCKPCENANTVERRKNNPVAKAKARASAAKWRQLNPDKHLEQNRLAASTWRQSHRDQLKARRKNARHRLRKNNYAKYQQQRRRSKLTRKARLKGATIGNPLTITAWEAKWKARTWSTCYWCKGKYKSKTCSIDHIVALFNGGSHSIENLCIACLKCNSSKSAQSVESWNSKIENPTLL